MLYCTQITQVQAKTAVYSYHSTLRLCYFLLLLQYIVPYVKRYSILPSASCSLFDYLLCYDFDFSPFFIGKYRMRSIVTHNTPDVTMIILT